MCDYKNMIIDILQEHSDVYSLKIPGDLRAAHVCFGKKRKKF